MEWIQKMTLAQLREEGGALFPQHADSVSLDADVHINWDGFAALEKVEPTLIIGCYTDTQGVEEGTLVGYALATVAADYYAQRSIVYVLAVFVHPHYRSHGLFALIMQSLKRWGSELGATKIRVNSKPATPLDAVLQAKWKHLETVYEQDINHG